MPFRSSRKWVKGLPFEGKDEQVWQKVLNGGGNGGQSLVMVAKGDGRDLKLAELGATAAPCCQLTIKKGKGDQGEGIVMMAEQWMQVVVGHDGPGEVRQGHGLVVSSGQRADSEMKGEVMGFQEATLFLLFFASTTGFSIFFKKIISIF